MIYFKLHGYNFPFRLTDDIAYKVDGNYYFLYQHSHIPDCFSIVQSDSIENNITVFEVTKG